MKDKGIVLYHTYDLYEKYQCTTVFRKLRTNPKKSDNWQMILMYSCPIVVKLAGNSEQCQWSFNVHERNWECLASQPPSDDLYKYHRNNDRKRK